MKLNTATIYALGLALNKPEFLNATGETGYTIYKNLKIIENDFNAYKHSMDESVKCYGKKDGDNYSISPEDDGYEDFLKEMQSLGALEVDVPLWQVDEIDLPPCESANAAQYMLIESLLVKKNVKE